MSVIDFIQASLSSYKNKNSGLRLSCLTAYVFFVLNDYWKKFCWI